MFRLKNHGFLKSKTLLLLIFFSTCLHAQTPHVWMSETEIELEWQTERKVDHSFEFATRSLLQERVQGEPVTGYKQQHIEFTYLPIYKINANSQFALGARYRFSKFFDYRDYNEFRIIPEYEYEHENAFFGFEHEARFEHRFKGEDYEMRPRYEFGISKNISSIFAATLSTTALWTISPQSKPEFEQRFTLEVENASFENLELVFGFEYRMEDYTNELAHEYFILTGANIFL